MALQRRALLHLERRPGVQRWVKGLTFVDVRAQAFILLAVQWLIVCVSLARPGVLDVFGTVKGVDFLQFYTLGWLKAQGRLIDAYDWETFGREVQQLVDGTGQLLYFPVYPPSLALLFEPLAALSYLEALSLWSAISFAVYLLCVWIVSGMLSTAEKTASLVWPVALGFPPFVQVALHGQISNLILALFVGAWWAYRRDHMLLFGLAVGSLVFKPQACLLGLLALLMRWDGRIATGMFLAAITQVAATAAFLGWEPWHAWLLQVPRLVLDSDAYAPKPWLMQSLKPMLETLVGKGVTAAVLWIALVTTLVVLMRRSWSERWDIDLRFSVLTVSTVLFSPHLYIYDAVVMILAIAGLTQWMLRTNGLGPSAALTMGLHSLPWLFLVAPVGQVVGISLTSPVLLCVMLAAIARASLVEETTVVC